VAGVHAQEITRRVNLRGIWQAAYTAGVVLPKPMATTQYWHRSLNPKKLISVGFSRLAVCPLLSFTFLSPWPHP
jgi:glycylpeptide N-tetradecanoyltransferase